MQNNQPNIDGFVVRRRVPNADIMQRRATLDSQSQPVPQQYLKSQAAAAKPQQASATPGLNRASTAGGGGALSLPTPQRQRLGLNLDVEDDKKQKKPKKIKRPINRKKLIKRIAIIAGVLVLLVGGYFAYKFIEAGSKIFKGNVISALFNQGKPLQQDANGNSNILLFGTSEDDPGHGGAELTDSIMLVSINQSQKRAFMMSVPRDLWVDYGQSCPAGYKGKINALYSCVKDVSGEEAGAQALRSKVSEVFGINVQYSVHLNYTALRESVDAVGGITVQISSDDPRGILDRNFDWDCPNGPQTCYNVKYPNGPATLNGKQALYLARARGDDPLGRTYGLSQANFDREKYQREILVALKDKASSIGTLANPVAVNNLLTTLGNNVRTNFNADEVKTLAKLGQEIKNENIKTLTLNDKDSPLVTTGMISGQSIVEPSAGLFVYTDLQTAVKAYATNDTAALEHAKIDVLNASGQPGAAQNEADQITAQNLTVANVATAPTSLGTKPIQLYDLSGGKKPGTLQKLQSILGVKATTGAPAGISSSSDFVIIVGAKPSTSTSQ